MSNGNGHAAIAEATCLDATLGYHAMGLPIVVCVEKDPGAKMGGGWQHKRFNSESEIERYFRRDPDLNVGLILGPASGIVDLECDDIEAETDFARLFDGCEPPAPPTYLATRGRHRLFAYHPKLEMIAALPGCQDNKKGAVVKFGSLECRIGVGEKAAQSLLPPSTTDGTTRRWVDGLSLGECDLPDLPEVVVDRIIAAAAEKFKRNEPPKDSEGRCLGGRPGDDFNARGTWETAFGDSGWEFVDSSGKVSYWRRPGKSEGTSGTTGHCSNDTSGELFYCFTSNAEPLQAETAYSKFAVFALLHHAGDFSAAATALAAQGYGEAELSLWKAEGRTDSANARRFVAMHGANVRYCDAWNAWLVWDGKRWAKDEVRSVEEMGKGVGRALWREVADAAEKAEPKLLNELNKWAKYTASGKGIREMLSLARSAPGVAVAPRMFDTDPLALCVANGVIDLKTGTLRPHRREDLYTKLAPVEFDAGSTCPRWLQFLSEVFAGDDSENTIEFIQRAAGYSLTGLTRERCLFFFQGKGKNGKTTLVTTLADILGDYATTVTIEFLMADKFKGIPTEVVDLLGRRFVVTTETEDGTRFAESFIKQATGGKDKMKGRRLYENTTEFDATHKLFICGNHRPKISGRDDAVWDRIRLLLFGNRFDEPDQQLPEKLAAEAAGILAWCVRGCLDWQKNKLGIPPAVKRATDEYKSEMDTIGQFIADKCVTTGTARIRAGKLFAEFRLWAEERGEHVGNMTRFGRAITDLGYKKEESNGVWYVGIGLRGGEK